MKGELGWLLNAVVGALVVSAAIVLGGPPLGFAIDDVAVIVTCVGLAVAGTYVYVAGETADGVEWPAPPLPEELPQNPTDVRARRLTSQVKGALDGAPVASRDLGRTLAGLVADRLVARHGADPDHPLREASDHLSPGLATYVAAALEPHSTMPRLDRAALNAYLKEIDAL